MHKPHAESELLETLNLLHEAVKFGISHPKSAYYATTIKYVLDKVAIVLVKHTK